MAQVAQVDEVGNIDCNFRTKKRVWAFTQNNWTNEQVEHWHNVYLELNVVRFRFQAEIGKKCGTPHLQGVVSFTNAVRWETLKELLPLAWWKLANNPKALYKYCFKDDTWDGNPDHRWDWTLPKVEKPPPYTNTQLNEMLYREWVKMEELSLDQPIVLTESHDYDFTNRDGIVERGTVEMPKK